MMHSTLGLWSWMKMTILRRLSSLSSITELTTYLRLDAQEVFPLSAPELDLHSRSRVVPLEQQCAGVFLQDLPYLKRPLHCQCFYGVYQPTIQGPTSGAEETDVRPSASQHVL